MVLATVSESYGVKIEHTETLPVSLVCLMGLFFWLEWIYLGVNGNRSCFFSFKEIPSVISSYFKSLVRFIPNLLGDSTNLREGLKPSPRFSNFPFSGLAIFRETLRRASILLRDS
jgi:hypothetical protein